MWVSKTPRHLNDKSVKFLYSLRLCCNPLLSHSRSSIGFVYIVIYWAEQFLSPRNIALSVHDIRADHSKLHTGGKYGDNLISKLTA